MTTWSVSQSPFSLTMSVAFRQKNSLSSIEPLRSLLDSRGFSLIEQSVCKHEGTLVETQGAKEEKRVGHHNGY